MKPDFREGGQSHLLINWEIYVSEIQGKKAGTTKGRRTLMGRGKKLKSSAQSGGGVWHSKRKRTGRVGQDKGKKKAWLHGEGIKRR